MAKKFIKPTTPKKARTSQPNKEDTGNTKKRTATNTKNSSGATKQRIYKSQKVAPAKNSTIKESFIRKNDTPKERKHPEYGTSNLETKFSKEFLDILGLTYQTQYKAESIGRYYDFYIPSCNTLIEVDGDHYHSYNILYENMSPMQKKNHRVDKIKNKWAREHNIPLIRIWEHDINKNGKKVMEMLKEEIKKNTELYNLQLEKKNRPK